jgi:hypothetical protein
VSDGHDAVGCQNELASHVLFKFWRCLVTLAGSEKVLLTSAFFPHRDGSSRVGEQLESVSVRHESSARSADLLGTDILLSGIWHVYPARLPGTGMGYTKLFKRLEGE